MELNDSKKSKIRK